VLNVYAANAKAQLTARPKAAPKAGMVRLLEAPVRDESASDEEVPLPLPPAEEVEFEPVEEPLWVPAGTVEFEFEVEAGETDPADGACSQN